MLSRITLLVVLMFCAQAQANVEDGRLAYEAEDYATAVNIFEKAARAGDSQGQFYLGDCYFNGRGVPQDFSLALGWFEASANQGFTRAQEYYTLPERLLLVTPKKARCGMDWLPKMVVKRRH